MLQGPDTDPKAIQIIREAVKTGSEATVRILNYRKGGEPFWNMLTIAPMADVDGTSRFFIGVQVCDRSEPSQCLLPSQSRLLCTVGVGERRMLSRSSPAGP